MVLATDLIHMMDDPGGPSHVNFDEPVSTFDSRYLIDSQLLPTKGNVIVGDGANWDVLGVGADTEVLTADAAQVLGVKWAAAGGGGSNWVVAGNVMQPAVDGDGVLIDVPTASREALVLQTTDDNATKNLYEWKDSVGNVLGGIQASGRLFVDLNIGVKNLFIGIDTGNPAATGGSNVGLGTNIMGALTTGYRNVGLGVDTLDKVTTGYQNMAQGYRALYSNLGGHSNTAVGTEAMRDNLSGSSNVAIGRTALTNNETGSNNMAQGFGALQQNIAGQQNTAVGSSALKNNTGSSNVGIGYGAAERNTSGGFNTAIGRESLYYTQTGSDNIGIGYRAGFGVSGNTYTENVMIGGSAGYRLTTGSRNLFVGIRSGNDVTTGSDNIVIGGPDLNTSAAGASNELNIGDLIQGYLAAHGSGPAINLLGGTPQAQQAHIVDADGTLADVTAKFNTLLADLEGFGFLAVV